MLFVVCTFCLCYVSHFTITLHHSYPAAPIMRCPSKVKYEVGESGEFECRICVNASYIEFSLNRTKNDNPKVIYEGVAMESEKFENKTEDSSVFITTELRSGVLIVEFEISAFCINDGILSLIAGSNYQKDTLIEIEGE